MEPLKDVISDYGWQVLSAELGVSPQAIRKWLVSGRLPRSEFSGETTYAQKIEAITKGGTKAADLLEWSRCGWTS